MIRMIPLSTFCIIWKDNKNRRAFEELESQVSNLKSSWAAEVYFWYKQEYIRRTLWA